MQANMTSTLDPKLLFHLHMIFETGSLSSAAELLAVSQPTLSRNVSGLEAKVGRKLMVRGRNGAILTEAGILLAKQGGRIGADLKQAEDVLNSIRNDSPPTIRIGVGPLLASAAMNDFVTSELQNRRIQSFHYQIGSARQLIGDLVHGRLDIAIMTTPNDMRIDNLRSQSVISDHIGLFAGPLSHLIGHQNPLASGELARATWLAIDAAFGATSSHENMLKHFGLPPVVPTIQFDMNIEGLVNALTGSDALCFLPARLARLLTAGSGVEEIPLGLPIEARRLSIWHPADADLNHRLNETIKKCRAFLIDRLDKGQGQWKGG